MAGSRGLPGILYTQGQQRAVLLPQRDLTFPCSESEALSCTQVLRAGPVAWPLTFTAVHTQTAGLGCPSSLPLDHQPCP